MKNLDSPKGLFNVWMGGLGGEVFYINLAQFGELVSCEDLNIQTRVNSRVSDIEKWPTM